MRVPIKWFHSNCNFVYFLADNINFNKRMILNARKVSKSEIWIMSALLSYIKAIA